MIVNKSADSQVIRDIENMFQMVELEASLVKLDYVPKGKNHEHTRKQQEKELTKFRAEKYREWIYRVAPMYADTHSYLHFQFARIVTLSDESVVQVMTRLRKDFNKVSLAERAAYAVEAQEIVSIFKCQSIAKKALH